MHIRVCLSHEHAAEVVSKALGSGPAPCANAKTAGGHQNAASGHQALGGHRTLFETKPNNSANFDAKNTKSTGNRGKAKTCINV